MKSQKSYLILFFKWLLPISFFALLPCLSFGQIYSNVFTGTGTCPTQGNTPTVSSNATGTPLSRNTVTCDEAKDVFNSKTLNNTASINDASYIEFSVTANANAQLNVGSLSFFRQASNTAPNQLEVRYSTDGFDTSTSWGAAPNTPTTGSSVIWDFVDFKVPPGTTLTFRFYPYGTQQADLTTGASNGTSGTFRLDNISLNGATPLPVNLVSFAGKSRKNEVVLNWVTAWEKENQGFEIQKSTNAKSFEVVGAVTGKYNSQTQVVYEFIDQDVLPGQTYYYRLKQEDVGGDSSLSKIIAVLADVVEQVGELSIFPNPNKGCFAVDSQGVLPESVKLYSSVGVEIPIGVAEKDGCKTLDIWAKTFLVPGLYYLHINSTKGAKTKALKVLVD